jgi:hypothetical protein
MTEVVTIEVPNVGSADYSGKSSEPRINVRQIAVSMRSGQLRSNEKC